ncbi:MAG: NAD(P)/FAD-dependent oxidoreductase [Chloroflexi bacterium]|nr:NAD(P)/FAD-dependent oxidoreductase [Chloroflexota bacterium]
MKVQFGEMASRRGRWLIAGIAGVGLCLMFWVLRGVFHLYSRKEVPQVGPNVVILGGGFAGLTVARQLSHRLAGRARITLIDRHNYHLFTPLLFQVAACGVDPYNVAYPIRQFAGRHGVAFRRDLVTGIDLDGRRVQLSSGEVGYDYLVIALGTTTNFFGNRSAVEHSYPLKWLEDGVAIRHQVLDVLSQATATNDAGQRQALLSFVVVGGGATGVEMAAALADLLRRVVPTDYPDIDPSEPRVLLIQSKSRLLEHMSDRLANLALKKLRAMGVEVWLNTKAKEVEPSRLTTEDGKAVPTRTVIWTGGVRCSDVVASVEAEHGKGGSLVVDHYLRVVGRPGVYAAGDDAHFVDPQTHHSVPLLAAAAIQEGAAVAENVAREIEGRPQVPYRHRSWGNVVSFGQNWGAVELGRIVVDGFAGWLAWRLIHLARLTSYRDKLATVLDWGVGYVYDVDTARLDLEPAKVEARSGDVGTGEG